MIGSQRVDRDIDFRSNMCVADTDKYSLNTAHTDCLYMFDMVDYVVAYIFDENSTLTTTELHCSGEIQRPIHSKHAFVILLHQTSNPQFYPLEAKHLRLSDSDSATILHNHNILLFFFFFLFSHDILTRKMNHPEYTSI
jgi:hypothetical protein